MTRDHEASRTLVKSPPELWAECSDAGSLARHLDGSFGEIRITRLEPESIVAWEGERVSGTVRIEPSGWGTRVTLTAQTEVEAPVEERAEEAPSGEAAPGHELPAVEAPAAEAVAEVEPPVEDVEPPVAVQAPTAKVRPPQPVTWWGKLRLRLMGSGAPAVALAARPEPEPVVAESEPVVAEPEPVVAVEVGEPAPKLEDPAPQPAPIVAEPPAPDADAILTAALDSLGQAHHRPFSRA